MIVAMLRDFGVAGRALRINFLYYVISHFGRYLAAKGRSRGNAHTSGALSEYVRQLALRATTLGYTLETTPAGYVLYPTISATPFAALTDRLGIPMAEIRAGLTTMSQDDNPGRSNIYMVDGVSVLVDFAHNPAAMQALFDMAKAIPAKRRVLSFGQAGDRTDDLIRQLARNAWAIGLDKIIVSELEAYWRGREYGDVFALIKDELLRCGATEHQILHFMTEDESLDAALEWAQEGDLVIMLALGGSTPIIEKLTGMES